MEFISYINHKGITMKESIKETLRDNDGRLSSKRVITFISIILMATITISDLFWNFEISQYIFESIMWIVISGLGTSVLEKFATTKQQKNNN